MSKVALVNGRNYVHKDIVFSVGSAQLVSLSSLEITENTQKDFSYGTGGLPVGYGEGRDEPVQLSFELSKTDAVALENASPERNPRRLSPFDIPVTWLHPGLPRLEILKNVMIQETGQSSDIDTLDVKVSYTAISSHVDRSKNV